MRIAKPGIIKRAGCLFLPMATQEKLRIDKYLWAIRLFKTRSEAALACEKGKVKHNGIVVKAARPVHPGEEYEVKTEARYWHIKVTALLSQRVAYSEAIHYYLDMTPAEEKESIRYQAASFYSGKRLSKIGRPTKKDRRNLNNFLGNKQS